VRSSSEVYVTGAVNNGQSLDWATLRLDMNQGGATSAAGQAVVFTSATATRAIFGDLRYSGTQVTSGTLRAVLLPLGSNVPVRFSTAPFGAARPYLFNNLADGTYRIQAFIDANDNLSPEAGEPVVFSAGSGIQFFGQSLGIPPFFTVLAAFTEFFGGIAVLVGALTRLAALGLALVMVVAALKVHLPYGFFMNWANTPGVGHGIEMNLALFAMAVGLLLSGGGSFSLDRFWSGD